MREPIVDILILNWNGKDILKSCLASIFRVTDYSNYKVIVVDNGSTDDSLKMIKKGFPKVDVISLDKNYGFVIGNNKGIEYVMKKYNPAYVLLLNSDTKIVQTDWLRRTVNTAESDKKIGLIGCKLIFPNGRIQWSGRRKEHSLFHLVFQTLSASLNPGIGMDKTEASFIGEVNTVSGACMLIKKRLIEKIGLLDEELTPSFQEDVEYSFRAWKAGFSVFFVGTVSIVHLQSYTFNRDGAGDKKLYWALRNSVIVSKKYFGFLRTLLVGVPLIFFTVILERRNKSLGFSLGNLKIRNGLLSKFFIFIKVSRYILMIQ